MDLGFQQRSEKGGNWQSATVQCKFLASQPASLKANSAACEIDSAKHFVKDVPERASEESAVEHQAMNVIKEERPSQNRKKGKGKREREKSVGPTTGIGSGGCVNG